MVAEPWLLRMGNQVSSNLKNSLFSHQCSINKAPNKTQKRKIGILSFEVANVMSKIVHLHKSLSDQEISSLKNEIVKSEGVKKLVASDESLLLELAFDEKLDDLNRVAEVVSRLGKKCNEPALQGFEHVYADVVGGVIDVSELGFLVKDMEGMIKRMERYVGATANLYTEMEVLNELEQTSKKFQMNQYEESRRALEQKLVWQRQDVCHLKDVSLWNQTYDKIVELLGRTVCTLYARICVVFGSQVSVGGGLMSSPLKEECVKGNKKLNAQRSLPLKNGSSPIERVERRVANVRPRVEVQRKDIDLLQHDYTFPCGPSPGRIFMECLSISSSTSRIDDDGDEDVGYNDSNSQVSSRCNVVNNLQRDKSGYSRCSTLRDKRQLKCTTNGSQFGPKSQLAVHATPSTVGGSALALHYANVIIVIEKFLQYPHLVGEEARDDLYQMLPSSLRKSLRKNLKSYCRNMGIYDAPLAHDWKETLDGILKWLAPLAHNMIRWQSERNFEQQQIVTRTNVLLLQTLYFADREKMEAAICELLVGLNYICRYEQQQNALLDCASSFDFRDWMEWQLQCQASYLNG